MEDRKCSLEDGRARLADGRTVVEDGRSALEDGKLALEDGRAGFSGGRFLLANVLAGISGGGRVAGVEVVPALGIVPPGWVQNLSSRAGDAILLRRSSRFLRRAWSFLRWLPASHYQERSYAGNPIKLIENDDC